LGWRWIGVGASTVILLFARFDRTTKEVMSKHCMPEVGERWRRRFGARLI
jgi:hypothetical protein